MSADSNRHEKQLRVITRSSFLRRFNGSRAILSGPAGGVVGYAITTYSRETDLPVIGFDMGGTSTDVSRFGGSYEHVYESTTAGVTIQAAQVHPLYSSKSQFPIRYRLYENDTIILSKSVNRLDIVGCN